MPVGQVGRGRQRRRDPTAALGEAQVRPSPNSARSVDQTGAGQFENLAFGRLPLGGSAARGPADTVRSKLALQLCPRGCGAGSCPIGFSEGSPEARSRAKIVTSNRSPSDFSIIFFLGMSQRVTTVPLDCSPLGQPRGGREGPANDPPVPAGRQTRTATTSGLPRLGSAAPSPRGRGSRGGATKWRRDRIRGRGATVVC